MAEPTTFPQERAAEPLVYRPLSGFAVASFLVGGAFAAYLIIAGLWSLRDRTPLLLPPLAQALPFVGAVLAVIAFLRLRSAEGTLAGWKLAQWGWWLSLLFGLGYIAYYVAVYLAVTQQAEAFTLSWFKHMMDGKTGAAFLETQEPQVRSKANPEDLHELRTRFSRRMPGMPGRQMDPLDNFENNEIVQVVGQGGPETQIQPLGVRTWEYKNGAYRVQRTYHLTTPLGTYQVAVGTIGTESSTQEYKGRKWQIDWRELKVERRELSPFGLHMAEVINAAQQFVSNWTDKLRQGRLGEAYLETQDTARRPTLQAEYLYRRVGVFLSADTPAVIDSALRLALAFHPNLVRDLCLPRSPEPSATYQALFPGSGLLKTDNFETDSEQTKSEVIDGMKRFLGAAVEGPEMRGTRPAEGTNPHWQRAGDRVQFTLAREFGFYRAPGKMYSALATFRVESSPGATDPTRGPVTWRVLGIELVNGSDMTENAPGERRSARSMGMRGRGRPPGAGR